jgi:Putative peptidoglycan binding domain
MSAPPDRRPAGGWLAARWVTPGAVVLAAALAGFGARSVWSEAFPRATTQTAIPVYSAQVVQTDVRQRQIVPGTIGYQGAWSVADELRAGVITALPRAGQVLTRGQVLYRVADQPATLFYGTTPAWRDIGPASTPGPDIRELDENLNALGYDAGAPGDIITWGTVAAVERWQLAHGMTETGTITLGQIVFLPGPVRVTTIPAGTGTPAAPGTQILTGTSTTPTVTVNLAPGSAPHVGDPAQVTLPDGTAVNGHVLTVGAVTQGPPAQNQSTPTAIIPVTVGLGRYRLPPDLDQAPVQVTMTEQMDPNVLAVPVTALLAQPGGGYAVRTTARQLIPVSIGIYDDSTGLVEVNGGGLAAGMTVQVAQG